MIKHVAPDMTKIAGGWMSRDNIRFSDQNEGKLVRFSEDVQYLKGALSENNCDKLINYFVKNTPEFGNVSVQGFSNEGFNDKVGSKRSTLFNPVLASSIYTLIAKALTPIRTIRTTPYTPTDSWQGMDNDYNTWSMKGLSPMLRFMVYTDGGQHYPHYDAGFIYPDGKTRTLKSFVLYLTTNNTGGTRIIDDGQSHIPTAERNHDDWSREANHEDDNIIFDFKPNKGDILIFNHRVCHDVEAFTKEKLTEERIIIRGDIIY